MTRLSKPLHCDQRWLEMSPAVGGRTCGKCQKTIVDFSRMSWAEIEHLQNQNNNSLCGMYSPKQLVHWGQEVPNRCHKLVASTALILSLTSASSVFSQTKQDTIPRTVVHGTLTGLTHEGDTINLVGAYIHLKGTEKATMAGFDGKYEIDLTDHIDSIANPILTYSYVGYTPADIILDNQRSGVSKLNVQLNVSLAGEIHFYVKKPTFGNRIKWRFQKWFGRKEKRS